MVWGNIKPWITSHLDWVMKNHSPSKHTWFDKLSELNHLTLTLWINLLKSGFFPQIHMKRFSTIWLLGIFMWCQFGHQLDKLSWYIFIAPKFLVWRDLEDNKCILAEASVARLYCFFLCLLGSWVTSEPEWYYGRTSQPNDLGLVLTFDRDYILV